MSIIIWILYLVTFVIYLIIGIIFWKKHSQYPDFSVGYHAKEAMKNKETWEHANTYVGKQFIYVGTAFVLIPIIYSVCNVGNILMIFIYFILLLWTIFTVLYFSRKHI